MNTIADKIPAYGMPVAEGPINKPVVVRTMPGGMGGPGGPEGMGGPGGPEGMGGPGGMPPMAAPEKPKPHPPTMDPAKHPGAVPGADIEPGMPGPGFPGGGPPKKPAFPRCESIDVIDGKCYIAENTYAEISGEITDKAMKNAAYKTETICLNGIYIGGESEYEITDSTFDIKGNGIDDFAGIGSAIMVGDTSKVTMSNTKVVSEGVIRPCTVAGDNSTLIVRNCVLEGLGGVIPENYIPRIASGMMEPPPGLKIGGNSRTHLSMGNSKAYFYDSKIIAKAWAALSTDSSSGDLYLEANNCDVICKGIGYGTYADNGCHNVLNNCRVNVATHVAIIAGVAWVKLNDCEVVSGQYCNLIHAVRGHYSEVTEAYIKGGTYDIGEAVFFVKSNNAYVVCDGAKIKTGKYLLHSIVNEDGAATEVPEDQKLKVYGIKAVFANGAYEGDIVHEDDARGMAVTFIDATVKGVITDAYISLQGSKWTATGDSLVCLVGKTDVSSIDAPAGVTITATAGEGCDLAGEYSLVSGGILIVK